MTECIKVINDNGQPWVIRLTDNTIEFYDARYEHTDLGQFVARYYIDTIIDHTSGLNLHDGVPAWCISSTAMARLHSWLTTHLLLIK